MTTRELMIWPPLRYTLFFSMEELAEECEVHPEWIRRMVSLGLLEPVDRVRGLFSPEAVFRIERIQRLRGDLGVNYNGIGLILDLLERIERLEERLRRKEEQKARS